MCTVYHESESKSYENNTETRSSCIGKPCNTAGIVNSITGSATHLPDHFHHLVSHLSVEGFVRGRGIVEPPGPQEKIPIRVKVYGTNDGGIGTEVVYDVLSFEFRDGVWATIVLSNTVFCL